MVAERIADDAAAPLIDVDRVLQVVRARIETKFRKRGRTLQAALDRWLKKHHNGIPDDDTYGASGEMIRQLASFARRVDEDRRALRQPIDDALSEIDAGYKALSAGHASGLDTMREAVRVYGLAKADREREKRTARATKATARAEVAAETAAATGEADDIFAAISADMRADQARTAASASLAELSRGRGEYGGLVGIRQRWTFRVTDEALVPREFLAIDRGKVDAARVAGMRNGQCTASIPGIEFYQEAEVNVR